MRKLAITLALLILASVTFAQTERSNYKQAIANFKQCYNNSDADNLFKMFSPEVKAGLPLDKTKDLFTQMHAQVGNLKETTFLKYVQTAGVYRADYDKATLLINLSLNGLNQIDGLYFNEYKPEQQGQAVSKVSMAAASQKPINDPLLTESPITLSTTGGIITSTLTISGTLTMPKDAAKKIPVVLIIGGSGPTDRDGNSPGLQTNTYKMIAQAFGDAGIASVRYDKRGVGQTTISSMKPKDFQFLNFTDDASALMGMLKEDERFSKIIIFGHSEGALVGMICVVSSESPPGGFISAAGAADPGDQVLMEQMKSQPPSIVKELKTIIDGLHKGKITDEVDPALYAVMRPSVQPYMMSWMIIDPVHVIKRVKAPMLIIQGTTDMQIGVDQAEKLKKAKPEATLKIIDGMSHILKAGPADRTQNLATYADPDLPLKPEFVTAIIDFVKGLK